MTVENSYVDTACSLMIVPKNDGWGWSMCEYLYIVDEYSKVRGLAPLYVRYSNMAAGTFRSTYYGVGDAKKDFDLHLVRVVPPSNNYKPSRPSNVMPSEAKLQRGRRTFAMSGASPPPPAPSSPASEGEGEGKSKSSWKKAVRGLFKSSASGKRKGGDPQSAGSSPAHPGPQQRSRSSTWSYDTGRNVASRPATSVEEGDRGKSPFKALEGSEGKL